MDQQQSRPVTNQNIIDFVKNNWTILAFLAGLIVIWTQMTTKIDSNSQRIDRIEVLQSADQATIRTFQSDIVEIKTTLEFIKQQVSSVK